jgi:hypothetical protein
LIRKYKENFDVSSEGLAQAVQDFYSFYAGIKVELRSEGCDDPKLVQVHCGRAYIKVNGRDYASKRRGHNLVILDLQTGRNGILSLVC